MRVLRSYAQHVKRAWAKPFESRWPFSALSACFCKQQKKSIQSFSAAAGNQLAYGIESACCIFFKSLGHRIFVTGLRFKNVYCLFGCNRKSKDKSCVLASLENLPANSFARAV